MKNYRLINNISGWAVFIVAAVTYLMTIEPTASLWDCGEFIASCFKLEVGHPPGNPVFMVMGRFFTLFAALVFWAILKWEDVAEEKYADRWIILIAFLMGLSIGVHLLNLLTLPGMVLVYYFKKFEFSWKGFSISLATSIILLSLLIYGIMPGVVTISSKFDWFFVNTLGLPVNSGMVFHVILVAILFIFAVKFSFSSANRVKNGVFAIAALFFTGIWVISGSGVLNILVLLAISGVIWYMAGKSRTTLNTLLTAIMVILIGYSANAIIVIRSGAQTPLNENNPSNPFNLLYFLNREQYGERPLFKGPYYNAPVKEYTEGKPKYALENGKYIITGHNLERIYDPRFITLFPRMWSDANDHQEVYQEWGRVKGTPIQVTDQSGEKKVLKKPTFSENLRFMFSYQFDYMYFRYFMWNFSGKQNDTQGTGGPVNGNWITGIKFLDESRLGTSDLPGDMKNDTSRNKYYLLPFLLGLAGMFYHLNRDNRNWGIILLLFVMTGIAIVFYLNQYPNP